MYVVGNYPDERAAHKEIGQYIDHYNHHRPHQALINFTPAYVHQINNKTQVFQERQVLKQAARDRRRAYWLQAPIPIQDGETNEGRGMGQEAIVKSRANMKKDLKTEREQKFTFQQEGETSPAHDSQHTLILPH